MTKIDETRPLAVEEGTMAWVDVCVTKGGVFIIDCDSGVEEFRDGIFWEDNFQSDPPAHLPFGAYRWQGFEVRYWDEDYGMNFVGGEFIPYQRQPAATDAAVDGVEELVERLRASAKEFERPPSIQSMTNIRAIDAMNEAAERLAALRSPPAGDATVRRREALEQMVQPIHPPSPGDEGYSDKALGDFWFVLAVSYRALARTALGDPA